VRELERRSSNVIAVRRPICDGIDPVRELIKRRRDNVIYKSVGKEVKSLW
jgi:hypothetical protein